MTTAQQRHASRTDAIGHSSVQPWSAGDIFPFVIVRTEVYWSDHRLMKATWQAINGPGGAETSVFCSYDACRQAAIDHLAALGLAAAYRAAHPEIAEAWRASTNPGDDISDARVRSLAGSPVAADGLVQAEVAFKNRVLLKPPATIECAEVNDPATFGVMCGGTAEATAEDLEIARQDAIPRLAREYVDLTPEARSRLMEKSRQELFAHMEANPEDQQFTLE